MDNKYLNEITYRKELLTKARNGGRLSKADREWLQTHVGFYDEKGYPFVKRDIIEIEIDKEYEFTVKIEKIKNENLSPMLIIPLKKGFIKFDNNEKVKSISFTNIQENKEYKFIVLSKTGLVSICYESETIDFRGFKYYIDSTTAEPLYMERTDLDENKIRYSCANLNKELNQLVFTIQWKNEKGCR